MPAKWASRATSAARNIGPPGLPTRISIDTTSGYLIDTANYNDFVILNGGVRYDNYNVKVSGFGATGGNPNPAGGAASDDRDAT